MFTFVDVYADGTMKPIIYPFPGIEYIVYVEKHLFEDEVRPGQVSLVDAYDQLSKDITRCDINTHDIPEHFVRFCTQAVMAFPLELVKNEIVAEYFPKKSMKVRVRKNHVSITKFLRVLCNNSWLPVNIQIKIPRDNSICTIMYNFYDFENL